MKIKWHEATSDDGKPMWIYINGNRGLTYQGIKAGDVWFMDPYQYVLLEIKYG